MKMNKIIFLLLGLAMTLMILVGCSGSKSFQGTWKVQDASGDNSTITFTDRKVTVNDQTYNYTQNAVGTKNGTNYYGITQNGKYYSIVFPDKKADIALMIEPDSSDNYLKGKLLYAMNKSRTPNYNSYVKKYLH